MADNVIKAARRFGWRVNKNGEVLFRIPRRAPPTPEEIAVAGFQLWLMGQLRKIATPAQDEFFRIVREQGEEPAMQYLERMKRNNDG